MLLRYTRFYFLSLKEMFRLKMQTPYKPKTLRESHFIRKIRLLKELVWYAPVCAVAGSRETKVKHRLETTMAFLLSISCAAPVSLSSPAVFHTERSKSYGPLQNQSSPPQTQAPHTIDVHMSMILSARMFLWACGCVLVG